MANSIWSWPWYEWLQRWACNLEVPGSSSALAASWLVPGSKPPPGLACLQFLKLIICLLALKYILQIIGVGL